MIRKIITIDETKCNGCELCVKACHEDAIEIINGKAKLISDEYCDGLGDCLPECPTGAISIIEREAEKYNEDKVLKKQLNKSYNHNSCKCPGTQTKIIKRDTINKSNCITIKENHIKSELCQWPIQLNLVNSNASYFKNTNLLIAADCTAYSYANFHEDFIKNHITLIGCPKLDDNDYYEEKLASILHSNNIKSITVVRMEVPCCSGIVTAVKNAMLNSKTIVSYREVVISTDGKLV
ncbi:ATP-binding protein [Clostridium rectalis]|uniref:ATP-binding protein n=1 Tax=Clostridium rectalis TaxID=2040295 RepID=UPI000F64468F|nr:4Fe-4S dicluster domain-containing protein [Clostridium rectalis]